jgi:hypothetical protein
MRNKPGLSLLILLLCLVVGSAPRSATAAPALSSGGPYVLDWWTVDGGGGASTGGSYSLTGTLGQPDVGQQACGAYRIAGGFWPAPSQVGFCFLRLPIIMRSQ